MKFYTKKQCPLCEEAKDLLLSLQPEFTFQLEEIDIYEDDQLLEAYQLMIPVIEVDEKQVTYGNIDLAAVIEALA
ncbi:glutaredoxin family protein [Radiobacillus sp. PE A8.2]|uniref:glutaredoxin family protein n=1 Tax=Radiobacillus sp. PE A8.2 TaxID=3380349 RepID=UPI00388DC7F7